MEESRGPEGDSSADSYYILRNGLFDNERRERHDGTENVLKYFAPADPTS